jgi:hypothetical protein
MKQAFLKRSSFLSNKEMNCLKKTGFCVLLHKKEFCYLELDLGKILAGEVTIFQEKRADSKPTAAVLVARQEISREKEYLVLHAV